MPAKMKPYKEIEVGFEVVETGGEEARRSMWYNVTLDESPDSWDSEIKAIDSMQSELGSLTDDARLVRGQIAGFARCAYTFPESVDVLLESIAAVKLQRPRLFVGCENDFLGFLNQDAPADEHELPPADFGQTLQSYIAAINRWLGNDASALGEPNPAIEERTLDLLGAPTDFKRALAEYLLAALAADTYILPPEDARKLDRLFKERAPEGSGSLAAYVDVMIPASAIAPKFGIEQKALEGFSDLSEMRADGVYFTQHAAARALRTLRGAPDAAGGLNLSAISDLKATLGLASIPGWWTKEFAAARLRLKRPLDQVFETASRIAFFHNAPCHKKYFRHVAILLSSVGEMRLRGRISPSGRDAAETNAVLLDYLSGLDAWLSAETRDSMMLARGSSRERAESVFAILGETTPTKRWLAACLWKTLKSGHSWSKAIEIDTNPAVVPSSWLKGGATSGPRLAGPR
jgi:hypothetical protein